MRRLKIGKLKIPFLLVFWFFKRNFAQLRYIGYRLSRKRKKVYETYFEHLLKYKDESPLNIMTVPPWILRVSGSVLVLGKYVSSQIYHCARSNRWIEIYGFVLGRRLGDLFIGETFFEVTNILRSNNSAAPDLEHVFQMKRE